MPNTYTVKAGDTFSGIALSQHVAVDLLATYNDLLKVGANLVVKDPTASTEPVVTAYVAKTGDTWTSIATAHNISVDDLMGLNNIKVAPGSSYIVKKTVPVPPPAPTDPYAKGLPKVGLATPSAKALQTELKRVGYLAASVEASDTYGPNTQNAVVAFHNKNTQFRSGITDPQIGEMGWAFLRGMAKGSGTVASPTVNTGGKISSGQVLYTATSHESGKAFAETTIRSALTLMGLPVTSAWINGYLTIALRESSYNPNAVNTYDSNAVGAIVSDGHPFQCSRGMWQCIPQTFAAYHQAGTSLSIYDGVASCAASINYVRSVYGVLNDGSNLAAKVQQADPTRPPRGY